MPSDNLLSPNSHKCWYSHLIMPSAVIIVISANTIVISANTFMPSVARTNASLVALNYFVLLMWMTNLYGLEFSVAHINLICCTCLALNFHLNMQMKKPIVIFHTENYSGHSRL